MINFEHVRCREFPDDEVLVRNPETCLEFVAVLEAPRCSRARVRRWETIVIARDRTARSFLQYCVDRSDRWIVHAKRTIVGQEAVSGRPFVCRLVKVRGSPRGVCFKETEKGTRVEVHLVRKRKRDREKEKDDVEGRGMDIKQRLK